MTPAPFPRPARTRFAGKRLLPYLVLAWVTWVFAVLEIRNPPGILAALGAFLAPTSPGGIRDFALLWAERGASLAAFAVFQTGCLEAGRRFAGVARVRSGVLLALPAGWGLAGLAVLGLALAGLARAPLLAAAAFGPGLALGWRFIRLRREQSPRERSRRPAIRAEIEPQGGREWALAAVAAGATALAAIAALAPETGGDAFACQHAIAGRVLETGRYAPPVFNKAGLGTPLWEMLLVVLRATGGEAAPGWFNPFLLGFLGLSLAALAAESGWRAGAWAAAALLVSNPFMVEQALSRKNDLLVAAFGLAAFRTILKAAPRREPSLGACALAGALVGCAFTAKYDAGPVWLALGAALFAVGRFTPASFGAVTGGFLLFCLPIMARSWYALGNPLFPFGNAIMPSPFFSATAAQRYLECLYAPTQQDPGQISILTNVRVLWEGRPVEETFLRWMAFLPALLLARARPPLVRAAAAALAVLFVAWMAGPVQIRYGIAMFPLGALLAAFALPALRMPRLPHPGGAVLAAALALQAVHTVTLPSLGNLFRAGLGLERPPAFLSRVLTSYHDAVTAASRLPPGSRVYLHGDDRVSPLPPRSDHSANMRVAFAPFEAVRTSRSAKEVEKKFRQAGWTHFMYNRITAFFWYRRMGDDPWTARDLKLWAEFWKRHAELVAESPTLDNSQGYFYLFRIAPRARNRAASVLPGIEGWTYRMDSDLRAGDLAGARRRLAALRAAAGEYGIVDVIEATMFRKWLSGGRARELLERSVERGLKSPRTYAHLAGIALKEGRHADAERWIRLARKLEPKLPQPVLLRMMRDGAG